MPTFPENALIVACGLQREARIVARAGGDVVTVIGGGNAARLEAALERAASDPSSVRPELVEGRPQLSTGRTPFDRLRANGETDGFSVIILSCGIAGALAPTLEPGDVVIDGDAALLERLGQALPDAHRGGIAGSDTIAATVAQKRTLAERTGALAVDMESHVAARVAARHGLGFAALRVISDRAADDLPPAALVGMRPDGGMALGAVLASLARRPAQLPALIRTGQQADRAFSSLSRAFEAIVRAGFASRLP